MTPEQLMDAELDIILKNNKADDELIQKRNDIIQEIRTIENKILWYGRKYYPNYVEQRIETLDNDNPRSSPVPQEYYQERDTKREELRKTYAR
jgi:hypothetical protein